jgi:hypothetical protein
MQDILKNKIIIYFALFGAVFALILGALSGTFIGIVFLRAVAGGLLMGGIGFGFDFFLKKTLPEEDYNNLFNISTISKTIEKPLSQRTNSINIVDDENISNEKDYESFYKSNSNRNDDETPEHIKAKPIHNQVSELNEPVEEKSISKSTSFENKPPITFEENVFDDKEIHSSKNEITKLKEVITEEKIKKSPALKTASNAGSVKFKVKNRNVTADPELIAKAIKTVLNRD